MGRLGFEPRTNGLKVRCSTIELAALCRLMHIVIELAHVKKNTITHARDSWRRGLKRDHDLPKKLLRHHLVSGALIDQRAADEVMSEQFFG